MIYYPVHLFLYHLFVYLFQLLIKKMELFLKKKLIFQDQQVNDKDDNTYEKVLNYFLLDLDKVSNLQFNPSTRTISFPSLHGNFDQIQLNCSATDQYCSNNQKVLTKNCSSCTSFNISSIVLGVKLFMLCFNNQNNLSNRNF